MSSRDYNAGYNEGYRDGRDAGTHPSEAAMKSADEAYERGVQAGIDAERDRIELAQRDIDYEDREIRKFAIEQASHLAISNGAIFSKAAEEIYEFVTTPELTTLQGMHVGQTMTLANGQRYQRIG